EPPSLLRRSPAAGELFRVDLRLLEPPGVVDVDGLPVGELLQRRRPGLSGVRGPGLLRPAERQLDLGPDRRRVDVGDAGLELVHGAECPPEIVRVDGRAEAVLHGVCDRDRIFVVFRLEHREHRPEDLFLGQPLLAVHREDRGRDEESAVVHAAGQLLAAGEELVPLLLPMSMYSRTFFSWPEDATGPMSVFSSIGLPTRSFSARWTSSSTTSS